MKAIRAIVSGKKLSFEFPNQILTDAIKDALYRSNDEAPHD
jgi:hypothetical protein